MDWPDYAVWWQVYPLGFAGAFPPPHSPTSGSTEPPAIRPRSSSGLDRLLPWLDYAAELGCSGLSLGPIFESSTHGYDTVDHFRIDARLGDEAAFDRLVAAADAAGLRVLLDGVFNHVGVDFPRFQEALVEGPDSDAASWFQAAKAQPDGTSSYQVFEGHGSLAVLNHASPTVSRYVSDVMRYWLDRGAHGWRLDAAYAVPPQFWRPVLERVRADHPAAWFVGEMIHGDYSDYVAESTLDSVTQYELWKAIWSSINDANLFELAWALARHDDYAAAFLPMTFVGNHDVTRIASQLDDPAMLGHALAILFSVAGSPSIYYGDEQAFRGVKQERFGGDDAIRPTFPSGPDELAPWGWPTYRLVQQLIALRRRVPWLARCRTSVEAVTNTAIMLRSVPRGSASNAHETVITLLNLQSATCTFDITDIGLRPVLGGWDGWEESMETTTTVAARSWLILARS